MSDETSVPDEPLTGETHGDPEILDEDPLLEEQPYSVLEQEDDDFPLEGLDSSPGAGSW